MSRFNPATAAAREGAANALGRYDYATLQSTQAADRLVAAWGLDRGTAVDLVAQERRRRAANR